MDHVHPSSRPGVVRACSMCMLTMATAMFTSFRRAIHKPKTQVTCHLSVATGYSDANRQWWGETLQLHLQDGKKITT